MDDNEDKKPLNERIEDTLDEALFKTQNAIYGEKKGSDDVPYTMETPSGFRRINKFATMRNIAWKLIKNPKIVLVALGVITAVVIIIALVK